MTEKKRVTAYLPKELEEEIFKLKMRPEFVRMTTSELVSFLIKLGLLEAKQPA